MANRIFTYFLGSLFLAWGAGSLAHLVGVSVAYSHAIILIAFVLIFGYCLLGPED